MMKKPNAVPTGELKGSQRVGRSTRVSRSALATLASVTLLIAGGACTSSSTGDPAGAQASAGQGGGAPTFRTERVCPDAPDHSFRCHALRLVPPPGVKVAPPPPGGRASTAAASPADVANLSPDGLTRADVASPPSGGLTPADIQRAYNPSKGGQGRTVAVVDAYDNPDAESEIAHYRKYFGLPACSTANGCFHKVNQHGDAKNYPRADENWALEIALDLAAVSAACPQCNILLVEANSVDADDFASSVDTAVRLGASAVSNSYGSAESSGWLHNLIGRLQGEDLGSLNEHYHHPGVAITVSTGDEGFGVQFPASSQHVVAVGGTSLQYNASSKRGFDETAWSGAGSGWSKVFGSPSWQMAGIAPEERLQVFEHFVFHNGGRLVADVAALADPDTGIAVYTSYNSEPGWDVYGGTSLASPLVAAMMVAADIADNDASYFYSHPELLFDVTEGSNGTCDSKESFLCNAGAGFDGPTGLGSLAFSAKAPPPPGCYANVLGRQVETHACVQSAADENWYQCESGTWLPRWLDGSPCSSEWPLGSKLRATRATS